MTTGTLTGRRAASLGGRPRRVVAYNRISRFQATVGSRSAEVDRGVDRQQADAVSCAEDFGLGVVDDHYTEHGSASEYATKERSEFERLLADIESGTVGVVLVWVLDRIIRDPSDLERLLYLCRVHGVRLIQTASGSEVDPDNPESVLHARISGAVAAYEAAKTSMRIRRQKASLAAKGLPNGGRRRFGYRPGGLELDEGEAAIVRQLVTRFLAGDSLNSLAHWLTAEGVPTTQGGKWTGPNLRGLLGNPAIAGLRVHQGNVIGPAAWPAIIPRETHDHVVAMLSNPARRPKGSGNTRVHLLTGIAVCDTCGGRTVARRPSHTRVAEGAAYGCHTGRHVHRSIEKVDRVVEDAIVARLARHDASGLLVDDDAQAEVIRLRDARAALDDRYTEYVDAAADMSPAAYGAATARLESDMAALDGRIREALAAVKASSRVLEGATGPGAAKAWAGWTLARKRAIVAELADVRLVGGRRGGGFNPHDVVVNWR